MDNGTPDAARQATAIRALVHPANCDKLYNVFGFNIMTSSQYHQTPILNNLLKPVYTDSSL